MEKMCGSRQLQLFYAGRIFCIVGHKATGKNLFAEKSGGVFYAAAMGCVFSCEYGCCFPHRDGYIFAAVK